MATTGDPTALSTAYALSLLSEYTQNIDSLPADVSRQFADLRELDAVLSASVHALTSKVNRLIEMIETNSSPKEQRIWLLMEIADEAQRLRLGGEDKIRVASQVADGLKAQNEHMTSLLLHIPGFNPSILSRHTVYPHIAPRSYAPISMYENGRRRRGAMLSSTADQANSSNKRRRVAREDDIDPVGGRTPRRERIADTNNSRSRNGARSRKTDRAGSPTESLLSITSHQQTHTISAPPAYTGPARAANSRNPAAKRRSRPAAASATPTDAGNGVLSPSLASGIPPTSAMSTTGHPSHVTPYAPAIAAVGSWSVAHSTVLTGPGVDGGGGASGSGSGVGAGAGASAGAGTGTPMDTGDGADDGAEADDGRLYCWCQVGSYGDMVACDDNECEREWFHLGCIGLEVAPEGAWFCEACRVKPKNKRKMARAAASGGGNRRSSGNPRSARAPSTT
ncbi:hypothetical protein B0F90DRAFT_1813063 [Multifurca ochricompacta]|uniref:Chromatin modification-related protein n=1 Tax=Multifurca ochricompacta TaxID=376703 RepID=A0AAD4QTK8_9AGAM|nr:hypothetical protein B0F90DRAFT_1813063 [Multifurca ochricompacta]